MRAHRHIQPPRALGELRQDRRILVARFASTLERQAYRVGVRYIVGERLGDGRLQLLLAYLASSLDNAAVIEPRL